MQDFELIELEGVVAHCLARQRLGLLERESRGLGLFDRATRPDRTWPAAARPIAPTKWRPPAFATRSAWPERCASARAKNSPPDDSFFASLDLRRVALGFL